MRCPRCSGEDLSVKETRRASDGAIRRRRRCNDCSHDFVTAEQIVGDLIRVRKSDGREELLDRAKLRMGIVKAAVRPHHSERLSELVETIVQDARGNATDGVIPTTELAAIVLAHLKEFDPITHIRYALTQVGRRDNPEQSRGWSTIDDVRQWLRQEFPELTHHRPATTTAHVVKRDERREPYDRQKLERSIGIAAKGRGDTDDAVWQLASSLADAVERELTGQAIVTSGQLSAEVVRVLRTVDHVAALRFASAAKGFVSIEDYDTECLGLRDVAQRRRSRPSAGTAVAR